MRTVRPLATTLYFFTRALACIVLAVTFYAVMVIVLYQQNAAANLPIKITDNNAFQIYYPFTDTVFLLGDYTNSYMLSNLLIVVFYGLFLWLLADVFHAFKQKRLFTPRGVAQLSRFYLTNLCIPLAFCILLALFQQELMDIVRITLLHLVIGVFAFFMAAIFKQGLVLQEEQDLIF